MPGDFARRFSVLCGLGRRSLALMMMVCLLIGSHTADAANAVGTTPGEFSVDLTGSATYRIPLDLPPGVNGLKPDLALVYNSSGDTGLMGTGWSLTGISTISRCPQTLDQDGVSTQPGFSSDDRFCLDGQRLVKTSGAHYGDPNSTYHTEIESFRQVQAGAAVAKGSCGSTTGLGNGPASFTVVNRAGQTSTYGDTTDSTLIGNGYMFLQSTGPVICENPSRVVWPVTRISDRFGNFISFKYYDLQTGDAWNPASFYIKEIDYGNADGRLVRVKFSYNAPEQQLSLNSYYQYTNHTFSEVNPALLTGIQVLNAGTTVLRTYNLVYSTVDYGISPMSAHPAELTSITECGSDSVCFNPTTFVYQGYPNNFINNAGAAATKVITGAMGYRQILDLDGDGIPDYVYCQGNACGSSDGELYVVFGAKVTGSGKDTNIPLSMGNFNLVFQNAVVMSLYGDGTQQLLLPYCSQTTSQCYWKELAWNHLKSSANLIFSDPPVAGSATQLPVSNTGYGNALGIDLTGSGRTDLVITDNGHLYYYSNTGNGLSATRKDTLVQVNGSSPRLYQVNYTGSGLAEIYVVGTGLVQAQVTSNGAGTAPSVSGFSFLSGPFTDDNNLLAMYVVDANGDGLSSVIRVTYSGDTGNPGGSHWYFYPNTGQGWDISPQYGPDYATFDTSGYAGAQPVDWFGDGRQELIIPSGNKWYLLVAGQGPAYGENGASALVFPTDVTVLDSGSTVFMDADGDGEFDMLYTSGGATSYIKNAGSPYVLGQITNGVGLNTYIGYVTPALAQYTSVIGDATSPALHAPNILPYTGFMRVVRDFASDTGLFNANGTAQQLYTYYKYGAPVADTWGRGLLGFAEVETVNYNTGIYTLTQYEQVFPYQGIAYETDKYWNPQVDSPRPVQIGSSNGGLKITCIREDGTGLPDCATPVPQYEPAQFDTGGVLISKITTTPLLAPSKYDGVVFPYTHISTVSKRELQTGAEYEQVETDLDYQTGDATTPSIVGFVPELKSSTEITTDTRDLTNTDIATKVKSYDYGQEATCPGSPTQITVTDSFKQSTPVDYPGRVETLTYDDKCFLTLDQKSIVAPPGSDLPGYPMSLQKAYTPDAYGNAVKLITSGSGFADRISSIVYDPTRRFAQQTINPLSQADAASYDFYGNKLSEIDANGNEVDYTYDGFERIKSQTGPMPNQVTNWSYTACDADCVLGGIVAYQIKKSAPDGSVLTTQYDELGRSVRSVKSGFHSTRIYQDIAYDILSRVAATSKPYLSTAGSTSCWQTITYDVINRPVTKIQQAATQSDQTTGQNVCSGPGAQSSGDRTTNFTYDGLSTTAIVSTGNYTGAANSETGVTVDNALGKPATVTDASGVAHSDYSYDPWGNLTGVNPPDGNKVSMTYDSSGDKLSMQDPDMGVWNYGYDALGDLLSQTDPNESSHGQVTTFQYDRLGRMVQRDEPEGTSTWKYDIAYGAGIGQLAYKVASDGVWEGFAYDVYGHPTDKITVVNGQEYWVTTTYDPKGRVSQLVYPDMNAINVGGTPAAPTGLTVTPDAANSALFDVDWNNVQNGAVYHLYRAPGPNAQIASGNEIYSGPDVGDADGSITTDGQYTWSLQACIGTNCGTPVSQTQTVTLPPTIPGAPQPPQSVQTALSWTLTWPASTLLDVHSTGAITYKVQASFDGGAYATVYQGSGTTSDGGATYSAVVQGAGDGTYAYTVMACTTDPVTAGTACSAFSQPSPVTQLYIQPSAPRNITVPPSVTTTSAPAAVNVSWTGPAISGGPVNYAVTVLQGGTTVDQGPTQTSTSYVDNRTQDGNYTYQVTVCNASSSSLCSSANSAVVPVTLPPTSPSAPVVPNVDLHAFLWPVTWAISSLAGTGSQATAPSYELQESYNGGAYTSDSNGITVAAGQATEYVTPQLVGGYYQDGTYTYRVRACNSDPATGGKACTVYHTNATASAYSTIITPGTPSSITAPSTSNGDGSFTVTFTAPASGSGGTVSKYQVQLGINDPEMGGIDWSYGFCTTTGLSCNFGASSNVGTYHIQVVACGSGVTVCSDGKAASHQITIALSPPPAPVLSASPKFINAGQSSTLSWTNPGGTISSYNLQLETTTTFHTVYSGTASSRTVTPAASDNWYRVQACNASGCGAWSNTVDVIVNGGTCNNCGAAVRKPASLLPAIDDVEKAAEALPIPGASKDGPKHVRLGRPPETLEAVTMPMHDRLEPVAVPQLALMPGGGGLGSGVSAHTPAGTASALTVSAVPGPVPGDYAARIVSIDPKLSQYPPLRRDPRVSAHFQSLGGVLPGVVKRVDCGQADSHDDCSKPTSGASAVMVQYEYDPAGYLTAIYKLNPDGSKARYIWVADDVTPYGQVDQVTYDAPVAGGPGTLQIDESFDQATGMLVGTQVTAGVAGHGLSASYGWDGYGNLKSRTITEDGQGLLDESFAYDKLNRLSGINGVGGNCQTGATVCYDAEGNPSSNGGYTGYAYVNPTQAVGTYSYDQPHALSGVTLPGGVVRSYQYDLDGNLQWVYDGGSASRHVIWASFNKPTLIQNLANGASETFTYGADHDRVLTTHASGTDSVTTTYIDGLFESEYDTATQVQTYRHYILAGNDRVAVETITGDGQGQPQADQLGFFVHDEVGSAIGQVTENLGGSGQQLALYSYDAWGKERPTVTAGGQSAYVSLPPGQFMTGLPGQREGFAAHEDLPGVGLVEMEGRVYDPEVGRFLSADPNVQYPLSTQGYNRYTYVNNNPLTFSDPTGYDLFGGVGQDIVDIDTAGFYLARDQIYWVDRRISPQVFAVLNTVESAFCGPLNQLCSAANTYLYERANGIPAAEAIRAAEVAAIEEEAATVSGNFADSGDYLAGGLVATAGGYEAAHLEGGDGWLGSRRALLMYGLKVTMDEVSKQPVTLNTATSESEVKLEGVGPTAIGPATTGADITIPTSDPFAQLVKGDKLNGMPQGEMAYLSVSNPGKIVFVDGRWQFSWYTEGSLKLQWLSMHIPGVQGFSIFHDMVFKHTTNAWILVPTIPVAAFLTYSALGGYMEYDISRDPHKFH